jgi:hypothetical protein
LAEAAENDVRFNVGRWDLSGLIMLIMSLVGREPF